jgi:hypothetical protein
MTAEIDSVLRSLSVENRFALGAVSAATADAAKAAFSRMARSAALVLSAVEAQGAVGAPGSLPLIIHSSPRPLPAPQPGERASALFTARSLERLRALAFACARAAERLPEEARVALCPVEPGDNALAPQLFLRPERGRSREPSDLLWPVVFCAQWAPGSRLAALALSADALRAEFASPNGAPCDLAADWALESLLEAGRSGAPWGAAAAALADNLRARVFSITSNPARAVERLWPRPAPAPVVSQEAPRAPEANAPAANAPAANAPATPSLVEGGSAADSDAVSAAASAPAETAFASASASALATAPSRAFTARPRRAAPGVLLAPIVAPEFSPAASAAQETASSTAPAPTLVAPNQTDGGRDDATANDDAPSASVSRRPRPRALAGLPSASALASAAPTPAPIAPAVAVASEATPLPPLAQPDLTKPAGLGIVARRAARGPSPLSASPDAAEASVSPKSWAPATEMDATKRAKTEA